MRKLSRILVPVALAVSLTACGGSDSSTSSSEPAGGSSSESSAEPSASDSTAVPARGDADLVIWTDALKIDCVKPVADAFGEANGISVDVQAISTDLQTNFVTANSAGNGPDVVMGAHDWIGNLVQNGAIEPLQLTPDQLSGYTPKAVEATTYDGQLYGVPYGIEALASTATPTSPPTSPRRSTTPSPRARRPSRPARSTRPSTSRSASSATPTTWSRS